MRPRPASTPAPARTRRLPTSRVTRDRPAPAATWARTSSCREFNGSDMHVSQMRVRNALGAAVMTALVVGAGGHAQAADRFVSTTGSDATNDCLSSTAPCATIGYALTQAASGDTVKVAQGTYQETLVIN